MSGPSKRPKVKQPRESMATIPESVPAPLRPDDDRDTVVAPPPDDDVDSLLEFDLDET